MFLSGKTQTRGAAEGIAELGCVTLEGDPVGVYLGSERRALPLFAPGGYYWCPTREQEVLVLKAGRDGETPCVAGARCGEVGFALSPGETVITNAAKSAAVCLRANGAVEILGHSMTFNGQGLQLVTTKEGA